MKKPEINRKHFDSRLKQLKQEASSLTGLYKDLRDFILFARGRFEGEKMNDGARKDLKILNNTGTKASRTLAAGMKAGITSPATPWFELEIEGFSDEENTDEVKTYVEAVQKEMYSILAKSNFYDSASSLYNEVGTFATAPMLAFEDPEDLVYFFVPTVGEYYIGTDGKGRVNALYRRFKMTVGQLVDEYGIDNVSRHVKDLYDKGTLDAWIDVIWGIEPNMFRDEKKKDAKNKKFISVHYEMGGKQDDGFLRVSGYDSFPGAVARWETVSSGAYGSDCPGMIALGDVKQLQAQEKTKQRGIQKNVDPSLQAPGDMKNQQIMNVPGGVTYRSGFTQGEGIRPIHEVNIPLGDITRDTMEIERRINEAYFVDLFLSIMNSNRPSDMKATVAEHMDQERLLMIGPVLERLHNEWLTPILDRVFAIAEKAGRFPEAPEVLRKAGGIKISYVSTLAQAQKAAALGSIERYVGMIGQFAQFDEAAVDKADFDAAADAAAEILRVPAKVHRSSEEAEAVREGRQQQQNQQDALATGESAARIAKDLSQAETSQGNILEQLSGI